jgi:DNA-binding phage protein
MTDEAELLDGKAALRLLGDEIKRAGSVTAWAKETGLDRTQISAALNRRKPISKSILKALGLKIVYLRCKGER